MQENNQPSAASTGCYTIEYLNQESAVTEKELFDTVFSKLKKIQRQAMLEKIKKDAKIDELMDWVRAGMITADKANEMIDYAKNFSKTDREILLNFLRNQTGGK